MHTLVRGNRREPYAPYSSGIPSLKRKPLIAKQEKTVEEHAEASEQPSDRQTALGVEHDYLLEIARLQSELLHSRSEAPSSTVTQTIQPKYAPSSPRYAQGDEIVRLNVGGKLFTTLRSTLCSVPGSMLEAMFSGRFGSPALRDDTGAYFLDRDPSYFEFVLAYLRDPRNRPTAGAQHSRLGILREFEYFGLLPDAGVYVAEPGCNIICTHHLELASRFSSMSVYGSRAYVSTETHIELWCLDAQQCLKRCKLSPGVLVRSLEATATRCFVLCGECEIQVWDAELEVMIKRVEPNTGWTSNIQLVSELYDTPATSPSAPSSIPLDGSAAYNIGNARRRTHHPLWNFNGSGTRSVQKRSLLFFDGDSGIYALDLDSLSISTVIEVKEQEVPMAFHVNGEELYFATEGNLNSFNLRTYKRALLSSTAIEFKRIRAIENELLVCWDTMGDRLIHFDLRTRNWTSATPSDRWHPLTEQCEVFRSLVVGRDFSNRIVLWCTSPLISDEASISNFNAANWSSSNTSSSHLQGSSASRLHSPASHKGGSATRVISLFNEAPSASSYFFQFQGSSIVVATSSPSESRTNAAGIAGLAPAGDNLASEQRTLPSGSIRVFGIRR